MPHFRHRLLHALTGIILTLPLIASAASGEHAGRLLARVSHPVISHTPSPEGLNKRYRYDANGELIRRADSWHGEVALEHDPTGRILSTRTVNKGKTPERHEQYDYDQAANLLDPVWGGEKRGYVRHNRLLVFEDKRYTYDDHGHLIEKRTGNHTSLRLRWNKEHQLVESTVEKRGVRQSSHYEYDALGRRVARRCMGEDVLFIWDGMRLLQEKRREDNTTYVYQPDSHEPVARIDDTEQAYKLPGEPAKVFHFHTHINGAPEELTNEAGQTLWRARYQTWGALALEEVPAKEALAKGGPVRNTRGEIVAGKFDHNFGRPVGASHQGTPQTKVRVHVADDGKIHGHPAGS